MPRVNWVMGVLPSIKAKLIPDRVFYPNMIGKILVNLVQNRVMISLLGLYVLLLGSGFDTEVSWYLSK